ncbi:aldolase/citrate lyase family protein [Xanthobacter sp. VTT E-85241]|uniref:HpcH/HpaI aldolase family protein n=1 Tax=Roseixanthobacter finlandensis TaxID=3119922 RepID=UPI00372700D6
MSSNLSPDKRLALKQRLAAGENLCGLFTRLDASEVYEALALSPIDVVFMDIEHGAFDRASLSRCVFTARAGGLPVLARLADFNRSDIHHALSVGVDGIVLPHAAAPGEIAEATRFARGPAVERAYAGVSRASRYRSISWTDFKTEAAERLLIFAQIDEPPGVQNAAKICTLPGLDGVFLGSIGLSLAMGEASPSARAVTDAIEGVCVEARKAGLFLGLSLPDLATAAAWRSHGVSLFLVDSDQSLLMKAAHARVEQFRSHFA